MPTSGDTNQPTTIADNLRNIFGALWAGRQNFRDSNINTLQRNLAIANLAALGTQYGYGHPATQRATQEYLKSEAQTPKYWTFDQGKVGMPGPQNSPPQVPDALSETGP
jgi:hypothetical protein